MCVPLFRLLRRLPLIALLIGIRATADELPTAPPPADYFVNAATGDDSKSGKSPGDAWRSLKRVEQHTLTPGDIVEFAGDFGEQMIRIEAAGTVDSPIILRGKPSKDGA